ncbi:hypothetical protein B0J17DRAFT_633207 [Rhizoctonia solani]|nr:hypothetical protein B0J17DRAFT_633207 [Rhizoctonia solani]
MVTYNVETELDIDVTNGSRGVIEKIILDHREEVPASPEDSPKDPGEFTLSYPPECVLVRLYRTTAAEIPGLGPGVIPIIPMTRKYDIPRKGHKPAHAIRRQLPITAAYAFTDYHLSQFQVFRCIDSMPRIQL